MQKFSIFLVALALLGPSIAHAEYEELDGIVAIVEDDVVLASELRSRYQQVVRSMQGQNVQLPPRDVIISQLMERLIIESLQRQEAQRRGVEIDDETLTRAVMTFAQNNNMTLPQFQAALAQDGLSYREFREEIRAEMMISRLQRNLITRRISISEQDIQGLLNSPYYKELFSDEYRVGHILLSLASSGEAAMREAEAKANEIVQELRDGADFAQMAIKNSSSSRALEGGDLGWRKAAELPTLFGETVLNMEVGDIAAPIKTRSAIHIVKLLERRGAGMQTEEQTMVRHILVKPSQIRSAEDTEALIGDVAQQLADGADFAELAAEHSEDPSSALVGGELGWATPDQFVPEFARTMQETPVGVVSPPFRTQFGWHILEVMDRREEDMSDEARERMALEILHNRRFEQEQQEWLKELRDEAFVEVRL